MSAPRLDGPTALVARTRASDALPDLLGAAGTPGGVVWHTESLQLAGVGCALSIDLRGGCWDAAGVRAVGETLRRVLADDEVARPGTGAVAFASLPFDPTAPARLVVPRTIWGRDRKGSWVTTVAEQGGAGAEPDPLPAARSDVRPPDRFSLTSAVAHDTWEALVSDAVGRIGAGALAKVVLARRVDVEGNRPFFAPDILGRLVALYPSCMVFAVDGFIGASPELLVRRRGRRLESHPLAGTVARSGEQAADDALVAALMASPKERSEHGLVIDALSRSLAPLCTELHVPQRPAVLGLRNVSHLATLISGELAGDPAPSALEVAAAIHPTPAVAGTPTKEAIAHLQSVEGFDRGGYAGPVGWVDCRGDGEWAVAIRSAALSGTKASMFAGAGIVADSDPAAELAETQLKLQALLAALVRP